MGTYVSAVRTSCGLTRLGGIEVPEKNMRYSSAQIRAVNCETKRTTEWGFITGVAMIDSNPWYMVLFPDGDFDFWPVHDEDEDYEFRPAC